MMNYSIVCVWGRGVEHHIKFSKKGGRERNSFLDEGCLERGGDLFQGVQILHEK